MSKRFVLLGHEGQDDPVEAVASDCAAVYALNGRLSSDEEIREALHGYGLETVTEKDIFDVLTRFDEMTSVSEADIDDAYLLSEDELIARVIRARDRLPASPLVIDDSTDSIVGHPTIGQNEEDDHRD